jgi:hypothetical protein
MGDWMSENRRYALSAQVACVRRELAIRKAVYPKWTMAGRMKAEEADHEINCMQAVHDTLVRLQDWERMALAIPARSPG